MQTLAEPERLVRFLLGATSSGVHLVLARYEHAGIARRARAAAIAAVGAAGRAVAQADFSDANDEVDIVGRLAVANARAPIVFAFGLEDILLDRGVTPRATNAIARLNFNRDLLPERLQGVVVLWLSYRAALAFASFARDTFDVISTSFEFPEQLGGEGESELGREFASMDVLELGDRDKAMTAKARAAAFAAKHDYDAALRILREDVLPVFEELEDLEQQARTSAFIATILAQRGE